MLMQTSAVLAISVFRHQLGRFMGEGLAASDRLRLWTQKISLLSICYPLVALMSTAQL